MVHRLPVRTQRAAAAIKRRVGSRAFGARRCTISPNLVITVAWSRSYLTAAATCRITHMDPFGFFVMLTMATFTLLSGGVLTSLVVLERKPHRSQGHTQPINRRRARKSRRSAA